MFFLLEMLAASGVILLTLWYQYYFTADQNNNLLLGVSFTKEGMENRETHRIFRRYGTVIKKYLILMAGLGIFASGATFLEARFFWLIYAIWSGLGICGSSYIYGRYHRLMYYHKKEHRWFTGTKRHISALEEMEGFFRERGPVSDLYFIPAFLLPFLAFCYPETGNYLQGEVSHGILYIIPFVTKLALLFCFYYIIKRKDKNYAISHKKNAAVNSMVRSKMALGILGAAYLDSVFYLLFQWKLIREGFSINRAAFLYFLFLLLTAGVCFLAYLDMLALKEMILRMDEEPILVDEDEFWICGYYSSHQDKRVIVKNRIGSGHLFNRGVPAGKLLHFVVLCIVIGIYGIVIWRLFPGG